MSRKEPSFGQLIRYMQDIDKSDEQYNVYQNLFSHKADELEEEFKQNASHIPKRKNGVYLYHEILSIKAAEKLDRKQQKAILRDVAYEYAQQRAARNLVFGTLHDDHDEHLHYHLLISSNATGESKKTRLSKAQFDSFKKSMEVLVLERYPELGQELVIGREAGEKMSQAGAERKRRTGTTPKRDATKKQLKDIFSSANDKQDLFERLNSAGMEFYARGNTLGVKNGETGRKHRLKTLGLLDAFHNLSERIELTEAEKPEEKSKQKPKQEQAQAKADKFDKSDNTASENKAETQEEISETEKAINSRKEQMDELRKQQQAGNAERKQQSDKKK